MLLSGGVDSAVMLATMVEKYPVVHALHIHHGQINEASELRAATDIAAYYNVPVAVRRVLLWDHQCSGRFLVPGRNAVLLSLAAAYAEACGATRIAIGCNKDDAVDYPDCRKDFLFAMHNALQMPVSSWVSYTKRQVIELARLLHVPLNLTWTCYLGLAGGPCGECNACVLRAEAE